MRVLLLLDWSYPCDHQFLSTVYAENFPARDHDVTWIMRPEDSEQNSVKQYSWKDMDVYTLPREDFNPAKNYIRYHTENMKSNNIFSIITDFEKFDLVHVRNDLAMGLSACYISQKWDLPFVHQISHLKAESLIEEYQRDLGSFTDWGKSQLGKRLRYTIASSADVVLPISEAMESYLQNNGYEQPMEVLPTGAEVVEEIDNTLDIREKYDIESKYLLIYMGSMAPIRRLEFLFDVLNRVKEEYDVELLMMGGRSSEHRVRLEKKAAERGVETETTFTGWIEDRDEINSAIASADIGLSPFPTDSIVRTNAPIKTLEYMAVGTPVIASRTPDQEEVLTESGAGLAVDYNIKAFTEAIDSLLSNEEQRSRMGRAGKPYLKNNRNFTTLTKRVEDIYSQLIEEQ